MKIYKLFLIIVANNIQKVNFYINMNITQLIIYYHLL